MHETWVTDNNEGGFDEDIKYFSSLTQFTGKQYTYAILFLKPSESVTKYKIRKI